MSKAKQSYTIYKQVIPAFSPAEMLDLIDLTDRALKSAYLAHRLLILRDEKLREEWGLSPKVWHLIKIIEAKDISEFWAAIMRYQGKIRTW